MIIDFWPTVLAMLSCRALQRFAGIEPTLARLVGGPRSGVQPDGHRDHLDQKKSLIAMLAVLAVGLGLWITNLKDMGIVSSLVGWLGSLKVSMSTDAYFVMFSVLFLVGMIQPRFNYWRLEPNEFVHYIQP